MKVAIATDGSEGSSYKLNWVIDHLLTPTAGRAPEPADEGARGSVILLHVQQPFEHYVYPAGPAVYATSSLIHSVKKAQEQNSKNVISRAEEICKELQVKAETIMMDGDPKDMICQAAEQMHADLLVVGSRGLSGLQRTFLGSVSDYVAHHAKCPVLIVKPPKANN